MSNVTILPLKAAGRVDEHDWSSLHRNISHMDQTPHWYIYP